MSNKAGYFCLTIASTSSVNYGCDKPNDKKVEKKVVPSWNKNTGADDDEKVEVTMCMYTDT